jgi:cold shock CspA family protein
MKAHEVAVHGTIVRLFQDKGCGFIETSEGEEIYFHRNSVVDESFEDLGVGQEVRLVVAYDESEHGAQASTVKPTGKHHLIE